MNPFDSLCDREGYKKRKAEKMVCKDEKIDELKEELEDLEEEIEQTEEELNDLLMEE